MWGYNEEALDIGLPQVGIGAYLTSSQFAVNVAENWQSQYLQFFLYILRLTRLGVRAGGVGLLLAGLQFAVVSTVGYDLEASALAELTKSVTAVLGVSSSGVTMGEQGQLHFVTAARCGSSVTQEGPSGSA